jgi:hypothetical protein
LQTAAPIGDFRSPGTVWLRVRHRKTVGNLKVIRPGFPALLGGGISEGYQLRARFRHQVE